MGELEQIEPVQITHMCSACAAGLPEECENPSNRPGGWIIPCLTQFKLILAEPRNGGGSGKGRPVLAPDEVTDPTSTGRKRAVMLAPILEGMRCEWAGLKHAGGGVVPIVGCDGHQLIDRKGGDVDRDLYQGDLHHGPDKNTLNNAVGTNLHRICANCHHRWHAANDAFYDAAGRPGPKFPFLPVEAYWSHDPSTRATDEEVATAEAWWSLPKPKRGAFPFQPDPSTKLLPIELASATLNQGENPFPDSPFAEIGES